MSLLESVDDFRGLYGLSEAELKKLCAELRKNIIDVTLENGGHLSSSLGTVSLASHSSGLSAGACGSTAQCELVRSSPMGMYSIKRR